MKVRDFLADKASMVQRDLALVKKENGRWQVIDTRHEKLPPSVKMIKGVALVQLMHAIANGEKNHPISLSHKEYNELTTDREFRDLCRLVPGFETPEHQRSREKVAQAKERVMKSAKTLGRGLAKIERQQQQGQSVGGGGRYVGQDQDEQPYWIRELLFQGSNRPATEIKIIVEAWKNDAATDLPIGEWEQAKRDEWMQAGTQQPFLKWVVTQKQHNLEKAAWQKEHPGGVFNPTAFEAWKKTQVDPLLGPPLWDLKEMSGTTNDADFQIWRDKMIKIREKQCDKFKEEHGAYDLNFEDYEKWDLGHMYAASTDKFEHWMLEKLWEKSTIEGKTADDLETFILKGMWQRDTKAGKTHEDFDHWRANQEKALHDRHQGTHLPLSFDTWKAQQYESVLEPPTPFILLDEQQRQIYQTSCEKGVLTRNGHPYDTQHEQTRHSGNGFAIFVIGPDEDLYSGSHIGDVFHHSSFLGEGAVIAAGEVKTRPDGSLEEVSSKSGHYQPSDAQNLYMLRYFRERGADLSTMTFTKFGIEEEEKYNAQDYLNLLEHQAALGEIDTDLFQ